MSIFRTIIIFLSLSTISLKANEVTVIELHKNITGKGIKRASKPRLRGYYGILDVLYIYYI